MAYYERRHGGSMRIMGPMSGDKLAVGDGLPTPMPPVATMDPATRVFEVRLQAFQDPYGLIYNRVEVVPFDVPGYQRPPYSTADIFSPWAQLAVQVDPSDSQVKLYMGAWSGDGRAVHSAAVFRSGIFWVP